MPRYRKKPVEVNAWQWDGADRTLLLDPQKYNLPAWVVGAFVDDVLYWFKDRLMVRTLEGAMEASPKDFIIQGVRGELYPIKPDIFDQTYDRVITYGGATAVIADVEPDEDAAA